MPRPLSVPAAVLHKASGQAVVFLRDEAGKRRPVYLGEFGSTEAQRRYREVVAQHVAGAASGLTTAEVKAPPNGCPTVARLVVEFLLHAQSHYRDESGKVSREVDNYKVAAGPFLDVLRDRSTDSLTCADLEAVRQHWGKVEFGHQHDDDGNQVPGTGKLHCRRYVNATMLRVKSIVRWGTERGLVPGPVWASLSAFRSLGRGRGGLRESEPVEAVPRGVVDAILPHLPANIAAAVELLWWSGMRSGELCSLRMRDVERAGKVWHFRPTQHKGTWKGRDRVVRLGPKCQAIMAPLLTANPDAFLFSPAAVMIERKAAWASSRKSKETPSQQDRRERNARKGNLYADQFDVATLRRAVHRACDDAGEERFGLHRLRHAAGTRLVLEAGDEVARLQLGHADATMVRRYSRAADSVAGDAAAVRHA